MVGRYYALILASYCLSLSLPLAAQEKDTIQIVLNTRPAAAEVYSADGSQRLTASAQEGFSYDRHRLRVGQVQLTHLRLQIRRKGYRSHLESIPSEVLLAAPRAGTVVWPPGDASIGLVATRATWTPASAWLLLVLPAGLFFWLRRSPRSAPSPLSRQPESLASAWELSPGQVVGDYKILDRLGEGVSAVVYKVEGPAGDWLALKLLKPGEMRGQDNLARFRREMKALTRLRHPNIPFLLDFGEYRGMVYLVMEWLSGTTLRERLSGQPVAAPQALEWVIQLARALESAHRLGILHRDLKPDNVILAPDGRVCLTDFGLARADDSTTLTVEGTLLGTPAYMAPEIVEGQGASEASDQYALGCLAVELLSGTPPYSGESPLAVALQHVHGPLPSCERLPGLNPEQVQWILTLLAKSPGERYPSLKVFLESEPQIAPVQH